MPHTYPHPFIPALSSRSSSLLQQFGLKAYLPVKMASLMRRQLSGSPCRAFRACRRTCPPAAAIKATPKQVTLEHFSSAPYGKELVDACKAVRLAAKLCQVRHDAEPMVPAVRSASSGKHLSACPAESAIPAEL